VFLVSGGRIRFSLSRRGVPIYRHEGEERDILGEKGGKFGVGEAPKDVRGRREISRKGGVFVFKKEENRNGPGGGCQHLKKVVNGAA